MVDYCAFLLMKEQREGQAKMIRVGYVIQYYYYFNYMYKLIRRHDLACVYVELAS